MQTILLVEDDPFLIDIYTTKLKEVGFNVFVESDGEKVLDTAADKKPALMLLDIVLPHMDGWEVLRKIKEDEKLRNIKVIILSNLGQRVEVEKGMKLGAEKYLVKAHYTPTKVVEEIKEVLKK